MHNEGQAVLVLTVRPCSRRVLVWRNGSAGWRTSLSSPSCSTNNSPSFPSPSERRLHTKRGKEYDGISKGGAQTDLTSSCLSCSFWPFFFHYNGLYMKTHSPMASTSWGVFIRYGMKPVLCFEVLGSNLDTDGSSISCCLRSSYNPVLRHNVKLNDRFIPRPFQLIIH